MPLQRGLAPYQGLSALHRPLLPEVRANHLANTAIKLPLGVQADDIEELFDSGQATDLYFDVVKNAIK